MAIHQLVDPSSSNGEFVTNPGVYLGVSSSIKHWQLRDLVCAGDTEDEVLSVSGAFAVRWDLKQRVKTGCELLGFSPISISYHPKTGYLAVGGQSAELEVVSTHAPHSGGGMGATLFRGNTEGSVHNALHIGSSSTGDHLLLASNNDSTVKIFKLPSMERATVVRCQVAINYSALSPCGQLLCCVGDSPTAYIYQETDSGYQRLSSFSEAEDAGMCCDFSPGLGCVASAYQDGTVVVWDCRSFKTIHKYKLDAAARSCKFAPAPLDLLAFTEHVDRAWLVDSRKWSCMQRLDISTSMMTALENHSSQWSSPSSGNGAGGRSSMLDEEVEPPGMVTWHSPRQQPNPLHLVPPISVARGIESFERLLASRSRVGRLPLLVHQMASGGVVLDRREDVDISGIAFGKGAKRLMVGGTEGLVSYDLDSASRRSFPSGQLA